MTKLESFESVVVVPGSVLSRNLGSCSSIKSTRSTSTESFPQHKSEKLNSKINFSLIFDVVDNFLFMPTFNIFCETDPNIELSSEILYSTRLKIIFAKFS